MLILFYYFVTFYGFQSLVYLFNLKAMGDKVGGRQPTFAYPLGQCNHGPFLFRTGRPAVDVEVEVVRSLI